MKASLGVRNTGFLPAGEARRGRVAAAAAVLFLLLPIALVATTCFLPIRFDLGDTTFYIGGVDLRHRRCGTGMLPDGAAFLRDEQPHQRVLSVRIRDMAYTAGYVTIPRH